MGDRGTTSKLSNPIHYRGQGFLDMVHVAYGKFRDSFLKKEIKPRLFGKDIFFDTDRRYRQRYALNYPERFIHIISMDGGEKYSMNPCTNDIAYEYCPNKCEQESQIPTFYICGRWECPYRMSRIHWIREVIELANNGDANITTWNEKKDSAKGAYMNLNVRYNCGVDDYILILRHRKMDNSYQFITAFPVVSKVKKKSLDKLYAKSKELGI